MLRPLLQRLFAYRARRYMAGKMPDDMRTDAGSYGGAMIGVMAEEVAKIRVLVLRQRLGALLRTRR